MQYQVPQFIEIEDKIFGPLTLRQFIYLAGGIGGCLLLYTFLPLWLTVILGLPLLLFALGLAFYRVNDRPLITAIEHAIVFYIGPKLYLWKQRPAPKSVGAGQARPAADTSTNVPRLSESKLKDLAWSLNIKDRERMGITTQTRTGFEI